MSGPGTIVEKAESAPLAPTLSEARFEPPRVGQPVEFVMDVTAEALEGTLKRATVQPNLPGWSAFEILCDEGPSIGGTNAAPAPLAYLSAGVAFCMLTHLSYYIEMHNLHIPKLRIEQRLSFSTNERTRKGETAPACACHGIEMNIVLETDAPTDAIQDLTQTAQALCMAHQAILSPTPSTFRVVLNGHSLDPS